MARSRRKPPEGGGKKKRKGKPQAELPTPSEMERAFAREILDHPYEDTRYLILADWLEEQGDPVSLDRAEMIRIQCQLEALDENDPHYKELSDREEAVLGRLRETWLAPLQSWGVAVEARTLSRGLLRRIHVAEVEEFCKVEEQVFEAYPTLRALSIIPRIHMQFTPGSARGFVLTYPAPDAEKLVAAPCLARIRELNMINCTLGPEGMHTLTSSPQVRNLNWLIIHGHPGRAGTEPTTEEDTLGDAGLTVLASSPYLEQLKNLRLWYNRIGPEGARALAGSTRLPGLRSLTLAENPLGDEGARGLAEGPALAPLEELVLHSNGIGPEGAEALARSPYLTGLKNLVVGGQRVGRRSAALLRERFGTALDMDEESAQEPD